MWVWASSMSWATEVTVLEGGQTPEKAVIHFTTQDDQPRKIGLVQATDVSSAGSTTVIEKLYEDLCQTPCTLEMPVGWHEFHMELGKWEWTHKIEIRPGEQTFELRRHFSTGLYIGGLTLTSLIVTAPIGVPMLVNAFPKAKRLDG